MSDAQRPVSIVRVRGGTCGADVDRVAAEEPLEVRLHNRPFAVLMRTPGADRELAVGFLLAERVIRGADDLGTVAHCATAGRGSAADGPASGGGENIVNVTLAGASASAIDRVFADRRQVTTSSSCGLCGRRTIESLATDVAPLDSSWTIGSSAISALPAALRARQLVFDDTGGLHAAGLSRATAALVDVGGGRRPSQRRRQDRRPHAAARRAAARRSPAVRQRPDVLRDRAEGGLAGIPLVAAVSAPSSLAIELAEAFGRHPDRLRPRRRLQHLRAPGPDREA